ncbi:MAG: hypothetical protein E7813_25330 [Bradyrhizobium sp.]|nr:hypothetical protein [Bradyrhizobium sp.]THD59256.1 MAG: hypothetical protein E7813_25330 [Bradyrhizobium sp.]
MVLKNVLAAVGAVLLACSGPSMADQYRADELFGLDLSKALLSPKPLGPATQFTPVAVGVNADRESHATPAPAEPKTAARIVTRKTRVAHLRPEKPHGAVGIRLARRHGNPLDAQAFDTRIQVWPCKSGGICNWRRN